ncbi:MAG: transposase [Myxococcota bacterium]
MTRTRSAQRSFEFHGHGGKRPGAGRKLAKGKRRQVEHRRRVHAFDKPAHVTLRLVSGLPSLRQPGLYLVVEDAIRAGNDRFGFRVVEFSAQANHLHLLVEADTKIALSRGMQGLVIRIARAVNRHLHRCGKVFADRFHHRDLGTPTEVRNCVLYVLNNAKHHARDRGKTWPRPRVDPFSSATWFTGWSSAIQSQRLPGPSPTVEPETWLLLKGWRKLGLLSPSEVPKDPVRRAATQ